MFDSAAPWTIAHQLLLPLPVEFSRQEYWSGAGRKGVEKVEIRLEVVIGAEQSRALGGKSLKGLYSE